MKMRENTDNKEKDEYQKEGKWYGKRARREGKAK